MGSWWLTREIELSTLRAAHVEVVGDWRWGGVRAKITLPASKNDQAALGTARGHLCRCSDWVLADCPVHTVLDQLCWLRRTFPSRFDARGRPDLELPLFPTLSGGVVEKGPDDGYHHPRGANAGSRRLR